MSFPYEAWRAALEASDEQMVATVDECLDRGVMGEVDQGHRLRFRHALVLESVYYDVSLPRRRVLHRRLADTLAPKPSTDAGTVAYHFEQRSRPWRRPHW